MIKVRDIEKAVTSLPPKDLAQFRVWFQKFDAAQWDAGFERDARAGKLDPIAENAKNDFKKGKYRAL